MSLEVILQLVLLVVVVILFLPISADVLFDLIIKVKFYNQLKDRTLEDELRDMIDNSCDCCDAKDEIEIEIDYNNMSLDELKIIARKKGIKSWYNMKKAMLIEKLSQEDE